MALQQGEISNAELTKALEYVINCWITPWKIQDDFERIKEETYKRWGREATKESHWNDTPIYQNMTASVSEILHTVTFPSFNVHDWIRADKERYLDWLGEEVLARISPEVTAISFSHRLVGTTLDPQLDYAISHLFFWWERSQGHILLDHIYRNPTSILYGRKLVARVSTDRTGYVVTLHSSHVSRPPPPVSRSDVDFLNQLPGDVMLKIVDLLPMSDIKTLAKVSRAERSFVSEDEFWNQLLSNEDGVTRELIESLPGASSQLKYEAYKAYHVFSGILLTKRERLGRRGRCLRAPPTIPIDKKYLLKIPPKDGIIRVTFCARPGKADREQMLKFQETQLYLYWIPTQEVGGIDALTRIVGDMFPPPFGNNAETDVMLMNITVDVVPPDEAGTPTILVTF